MHPAHYPVSLVVAGRPCLVVGGGPVAARKVAGLLRSGAAVTVVAPEVAAEIEELAGGPPRTGLPGGGGPGAARTAAGAGAGTLAVVRRAYAPGDAAGYRLVVTATGNPAVDRAVAADAEAAGVWVNCADDAAHCSAILPSVHRDGTVTMAVSTGGASPALASWLCRRLAAAAPPALGTLASLLEEARSRLLADGRPTAAVDWQALLDGPLPGLVAEGRLDEARALLRRATG